MELALAIGIVGVLAVVAAWHTAFRAMGARVSSARIEALRITLDSHARMIADLGNALAELGVLVKDVAKNVEAVEHRANELAANIALRPAREMRGR